MAFDIEGLLTNPMMGFATGLLDSRGTYGSFGASLNNALKQANVMRSANKNQEAKDLLNEMKKQQLDMLKRGQLRRKAFQDNVQGIIGTPEKQVPFEQDIMEGEEQPIPGLLSQQGATGMYAQNPTMAATMDSLMTNYPDQAASAMLSGMFSKTGGQFSKSPTLVKGPDGRLQILQLSAQGPGAAQLLPLPEGMTPVEPQKYMNLGTGFQGVGSNTGMPGGFWPIDYMDPEIRKRMGQHAAETTIDTPTKLRNLRGELDEIDRTIGSLQELSGLTDWSSAGFGAYLANLPYTKANEWRSLKSTIVSNIGLNKLSQMKAQTSTGASGMGALSERELQLLIDNVQALEQATDPKVIHKRIEKVIDHYNNLREYAMADWQSMYSNYMRTQPLMPQSMQRDIPAPPPPPPGGQDGWSIKPKGE